MALNKTFDTALNRLKSRKTASLAFKVIDNSCEHSEVLATIGAMIQGLLVYWAADVLPESL